MRRTPNPGRAAERSGSFFAWAVAVTVLAVGALSPAWAIDPDLRAELRNRVVYFYQNPDLDGVPNTLRILEENNLLEEGAGDVHAPTIGFLAALFERHPERVDAWIAVPYSLDVQRLIGYGLVQAGMEEESAVFLRRNGWPDEVIDIIRQAPPSILGMPIEVAPQLDMVWGASFATGDRRYPEKIIDFLAETLASGKFGVEDIAYVGRPENVSGRNNPELVRILGRHGTRGAYELVLNGTALWGLGSNAKQHGFVMEAVQARIAEAPQSDLGYLLRKAVFRATSSPLAIVEGDTFKAILLQTSEADVDERVGQGIDALTGMFEAYARTEFAAGEPVFVAVALLLPPTGAVETSFSVRSPGGAGFGMGPFRWRVGEDGGRLAIRAVPLAPGGLAEEGVYTVTARFREEGRDVVTTESRFFVGTR